MSSTLTTPMSISKSSSIPLSSAENTVSNDQDTSPHSSSVEQEEPQSLSQSFPCLYTLKEQRAYEHERQRTKHAVDFFTMRARKGKETYPQKGVRIGWLPSYFSRSASESDSDKAKHQRIDSASHEVDDGIDWTSNRQTNGNAVHRSHVAKPIAVTTTTEATLSDLIVSARRTRKMKESDFEVVPHVRSVIVLDDVVARDIVIDEPWEYVGLSDEDTLSEKAPTYADIVSSTPPN